MVNMSVTILTSVGDILAALAYFTIPAEMFYFIKKQQLSKNLLETQYTWVLYAFVIFILCCGCTHVIMSFYPYFPVPIINCFMKWVTALISLYTCYLLYIVIPKVLYFPIHAQNIENENLERQLHEHFLQENVNIFRQIREYTKSLNNKKEKFIYKEVSNILYTQLKFENCLYLYNENEKICKRVSYLPENLQCPDKVEWENVDTKEFVNEWWLIQFNTFIEDFKGYIAIRMKPNTDRVIPRKNIIINFNDNSFGNDVCVNLDDSRVDISRKSYVDDIILDIIEHFESSLIQAVSTEMREMYIEKLKQHNEALVKSRQEGKMVVKQSRDWLSVMSHEMRTPLFAVESLAQLLLEKCPKSDRDTYTSLELINVSAINLSEIINNILDYSKFENNDYVLDNVAFDIRDIVTESVSINVRNEKRCYPQVCIFINDNVPECLTGDALRVRQLIVNLVSNAVKFTNDEGCIDVKVSCIFLDKNDVMLSVKVLDTGIGIKKNDHDKLFKQFSQSDASITRKYGGSGLGLSICKKICEIMGGEIGFYDNTPEGSVFHFSVKLDVKKSKIKTYNQLHAIYNWRIHIIDDSKSFIECVKLQLKSLGFQRITSGNSLTDNEKDLYILNTRCKNVSANTETTQNFINNNKVILYTVLYIKSLVNLQCKYELLQPLILKELADRIETLAIDNGFIQKSNEKSIFTGEQISQLVNFRILVAEDNIINQKVIVRILKKFNTEADFANDGKEAVEKYKQSLSENKPYNVILMDIMMPEMDGYTATSHIRKLEKNVKEPWIIALTANAFWDDKVKAEEAGMDDFVTKPAKIDTLRSALKNAKI